MHNSKNIWCLIARALNNEASEGEKEELAAILSKNESLQQQFDLLSRIWKEEQHIIENQDKQSAQNTISRIIYKAELEAGADSFNKKTSFIGRKRWMAVAASVAILVVSGWLWMSNKSSDKIAEETIEAKYGSRSRSLLPDGTTVWLNAGSKLYYDGDFTGATREVKLEGEAFFDVVKQTSRPFIVHTSGIDIKVLGTAFNVKSYPEDKTVETTLYRGAVKVFRETESEAAAIQLRPNEKLVLQKEAANKSENLSTDIQPATAKETKSSFTITRIDSTKKESERYETAWLYSRLEFRGDNFEQLAKKLERWYNVTIVFTDEKVKQLTVYGSFEKETVEQAFAALKEGFPITYKIDKHEISVGSVE